MKGALYGYSGALRLPRCHRPHGACGGTDGAGSDPPSGGLLAGCERLRDCFPDIPLEQVPGNCDFRPIEPAERLLEIRGKRILLCHGHTYGVKQSLLTAGYAAEERQLDLFLFGHTHRPLVDRRGRTLFLNPGSIGASSRPSYGVVTVQGGQLDGRTAWLT